MVDALVSVVAKNLLEMARDETILLTGVRDELEDLSSELRTIRAVLQDAEMKQIKDEAVRIWLQNLKYVAYEIEDMVEAWDQVRNSSSPFSCTMHPFRHSKFGHKVKTIKQKLAKIASEKDRYHFREIFYVRETEERQTYSFVEQSSVIGRDGDKETLRIKLIDEDLGCREGDVPPIAIVGMGGLGKTTLAQVVFSDEAIRSNFEKCIWVCISNDFNIKDILINIAKNGGGSIYKRDDDQIELIQQEVVKVIGNKRYLLILDDVWNENGLTWGPLQSILNCGADGSRIVVTTRSRGVAHAIRSAYIHDLGLLPKDDCWFIFQKLVFDKNNYDIQGYKELEELGKQIVENCNGLPLAVKTIASAIQKKVRGKQPIREQLENILSNEVWDVLKSNVGILPALMLSYIELPPELKNCFCYCSLFEKDFVFKKELLTKMWVAQGYVVANDEQREVEYIAEEYFDELLDRSLLQEPGIDKHGNITCCKMHDLVHDLAQWITKTEFSVMKLKHPKNRMMSLGNARHCVILGELKWKRDIALTGIENLRTLTYFVKYIDNFHDKWNIGGVIKQLQSVRVLSLHRVRMRELDGLERLVHIRYLDLSYTGIRVLPKSIGKLKQLRYLVLSWTEVERFPKAITSLSHLHTLNLSFCLYLMELPDGIHEMNSLRHLDVTGCWRLKKLPYGIGRLTLLHTVCKFPVAIVGGGKGGHSNIGELGGLNRLCGHLSITKLGGVGGGEEARTAKLLDKTSLTNIELSWDYGESPHPAAMGVLDSLHPPPKLETLCVVNYPGEAFPSWVGDGSAFPLLSVVVLSNCINCTQLPSLGQLPCLKRLWIGGLSGVKKVGEEFLYLGLGLGDDEGGTSIVAFPQLESLNFVQMDCWEQWAPPLSASSSSSSSIAPVKKAATLPRLTELEFNNCPKLEGVPTIFTTALQTLCIIDCNMLRSLQFFPPSIQSLKLTGVSTRKLLADCATTLPSLQHLEITADSELTDQLPPTLLHLTTLQSLKISFCRDLKTLPEGLTRLTSLHKLVIHCCSPELSDSCEVGGLLWPRIAHIPHIQIDFREVQNHTC